MRRGLSLALLLTLLLAARYAWADASVPVDLQVDLVRKLVRFERGFAGRVGGTVVVLIVTRPTQPASARAAAQVQEAFERAPDLAGKPVKIVKHSFSTTAALRQVAEGTHLVFLTPGFEGEMAAIAQSFSGLPAITVGTDSELVAKGAVLGFELIASKPKITLNLGQARRQALDFSSELFRLANVIQ